MVVTSTLPRRRQSTAHLMPMAHDPQQAAQVPTHLNVVPRLYCAQRTRRSSPPCVENPLCGYTAYGAARFRPARRPTGSALLTCGWMFSRRRCCGRATRRSWTGRCMSAGCVRCAAVPATCRCAPGTARAAAAAPSQSGECGSGTVGVMAVVPGQYMPLHRYHASQHMSGAAPSDMEGSGGVGCH